MDHRIYKLFRAKSPEEAITILKAMKFRKLPKTQKQLGNALAVFRDQGTSIECEVFADHIFYVTRSPAHFLKDAVRMYQITHTHFFAETVKSVKINYEKTINTHEVKEDEQGNILESVPVTKKTRVYEDYIVDERFVDELCEITKRKGESHNAFIQDAITDLTERNQK